MTGRGKKLIEVQDEALMRLKSKEPKTILEIDAQIKELQNKKEKLRIEQSMEKLPTKQLVAQFKKLWNSFENKKVKLRINLEFELIDIPHPCLSERCFFSNEPETRINLISTNLKLTPEERSQLNDGSLLDDLLDLNSIRDMSLNEDVAESQIQDFMTKYDLTIGQMQTIYHKATGIKV